MKMDFQHTYKLCMKIAYGTKITGLVMTCVQANPSAKSHLIARFQASAAV
jgi:hypothetical protein